MAKPIKKFEKRRFRFKRLLTVVGLIAIILVLGYVFWIGFQLSDQYADKNVATIDQNIIEASVETLANEAVKWYKEAGAGASIATLFLIVYVFWSK